jgi:hypothetical protein
MSSYEPVEVRESSTSYFSVPEPELDPSLFEGTHLRPHVRQWILSTVHDFLDDHFIGCHDWSRIWIAGSAISYQWSASHGPGDLDLMLGVNYVRFRQANPQYAGMTDSDIAKTLNEYAYTYLYPEIDGVSFGRSNFEVTLYANLGVTADRDAITFINPYAAYDVTQDEWAVLPQKNPTVNIHPSWEMSAESDRARGVRIVDMYNHAITQVRGATNPAHRTNAEAMLKTVLDSAVGLYDEIHAGRKAAFNPHGAGYADFHNYRWQAGKRNGVIQSMKRLKDYVKADAQRTDFETYGMELPDTETLIRRAQTMYRSPRG